MTEDEAQTKWCPHAVASHTNPRAKSGYDDDDAGVKAGSFYHNCIGSACMAWRLGPAEAGEVLERRPAGSGSRKPDGEGWTHERPGQNPQGGDDWVRRQVIRPGYCGLAGAPS